jgi:methyl acetate hydrolase
MSLEAIDRVLRRAQSDGVAPGLTAAAHLADGRDYVGAFGQRGVSDPAAMTSDTLFWVASMTKLVTSIAAVQLVEQGRLPLDQDAADILPAIRAAPILDGFDPDGAPRLRQAKRPVTVKHLLTHTSGFGYPFFSETLGRYAAQLGEGAGRVMGLPRLFEAGDYWLYGINTDLVGQIVEAISGEGLDAYLQRHVFDVLGMGDTTFARSVDQAGRTATMHARAADGTLTATPFALPPPPSPMLGGGGLYSTAPDYLILLKSLLNNGAGARGRILSPSSVALLTSNQVGELDCGVLRSSSPSSSHDFEPMPGQPKRWSLGLMINEQPGPDGRGAGAGSWAGVSNCYYWLDPAAGVAGLVLAQLMPFGDPAVLGLFSAFERASTPRGDEPCPSSILRVLTSIGSGGALANRCCSSTAAAATFAASRTCSTGRCPRHST